MIEEASATLLAPLLDVVPSLLVSDVVIAVAETYELTPDRMTHDQGAAQKIEETKQSFLKPHVCLPENSTQVIDIHVI